MTIPQTVTLIDALRADPKVQAMLHRERLRMAENEKKNRSLCEEFTKATERLTARMAKW